MSVHPSYLDEVMDILRCPLSHSPLELEGDELVSAEGGYRYRIENGIPRLLAPTDNEALDAKE